MNPSDEQLTEAQWAEIDLHVKYTPEWKGGPDWAYWAMADRALLLDEVRASHAREAELLRDNLVINKATFMRTHPDSHLGHAPSIAYSALEAERDVLQQRIDKALELHQEVVRAISGGQFTDAAGKPVPFVPAYVKFCSCGNRHCTTRAVLTEPS